MFEVLIALNLASPLISQSLLDLSLFGLALYLIQDLWRYRNTKPRKAPFSSSSQDVASATSQKHPISKWNVSLNGVTEFFKDSVNRRVLIATLLYFIICALSLFLNANPLADKLALFKFQWILHIFIYAWAGIVFFRRLDAPKIDFLRFGFNFSRFNLVFLVLLAIPVLYGFNVFFNNGFDLLASRITGMRAVGLINSATYHGILSGAWFLVFVSLALWTRVSKNSFSWFSAAVTGFFIFALFAAAVSTFTRGVWLSVTATLVVSAIYFFRRRLMSKFAFITFGICFLLAGATGYFQFSKIESLLKSRWGSDQCRIELMRSHIRMAQEYPLLGIGYRDNLRSIKEYWPESNATDFCKEHRSNGNQAHNQYLNALGTTGILGLLLFLSFHFLFLKETLALLKRTHIAELSYGLLSVCLVIQIFYLITYMTESTFDYGKVRTLLLVAWGLVLAVRFKLNEKSRPNKD